MSIKPRENTLEVLKLNLFSKWLTGTPLPWQQVGNVIPAPESGLPTIRDSIYFLLSCYGTFQTEILCHNIQIIRDLVTLDST